VLYKNQRPKSSLIERNEQISSKSVLTINNRNMNITQSNQIRMTALSERKSSFDKLNAQERSFFKYQALVLQTSRELLPKTISNIV